MFSLVDSVRRDSYDENEDCDGNVYYELNETELFYSVINLCMNVLHDSELQKECIKLLEERYINDKELQE